MESVISLSEFQDTIWNHYHSLSRSFPWRETHNPYRILVSEIMLQQTQTGRVVEKYEAFIAAFPTVQDLAAAPVPEVLRLWQGLGYNRRGLNLKRAAVRIVEEYGGVVPHSPLELKGLPGIGDYTAGAIAAFAYNRPVTFIETNIRRVYIHFFFPEAEAVLDKQLMPLIERTVSVDNPREWYYALMDYGAHLPRITANPNRRSKHYGVQSAFEGSNRQVRGRILAFLLKQGGGTLQSIAAGISLESERVQTGLEQLRSEGFLREDDTTYRLTTEI